MILVSSVRPLGCHGSIPVPVPFHGFLAFVVAGFERLGAQLVAGLRPSPAPFAGVELVFVHQVPGCAQIGREAPGDGLTEHRLVALAVFAPDQECVGAACFSTAGELDSAECDRAVIADDAATQFAAGGSVLLGLVFTQGGRG
ncbi:hypothetical protein [Tsukamurella sp. 1534]|uniref:hypothetical protein n=1 Tax=Tsukamurella sp. 1534 TaxID=1151061 RepID=UPI0005947C8E|nr:hypothetical protein [Tsukamurella sp. 1534]